MANVKIPTRELGKSGIKVGEIGLGCMTMSTVPFGAPGSNPSVSKEPWFEVMKKAIELGCTCWNTGEFYGDNMLVIREFFEKNPSLRDEVFIAVKAGVQNMAPCGDPDFIKSNVDFNIQKLGSRVDLYQMARVDPKTPIEVTMGALAECVKSGKIGHIGLSECSEDTIRRAHKIHPITCVEIEYSLWARECETNGVLKACEELGITIIAYSPLGRGFLAGQYKSAEEAKFMVGFFPRFQEENFNKNMQLYNALEKMATKHSITPAQLCLAWLLAQSPMIIPIPGTTKPERLVSNLDSVKIHLSKEDIKDITDAMDKFEVVGGRYSEHHAHLLYGNSKPLN